MQFVLVYINHKSKFFGLGGMKAFGGMKLHLFRYLNSAVDGSDCWATCYGSFTPPPPPPEMRLALISFCTVPFINSTPIVLPSLFSVATYKS
jgi:hypothetical protein